MATVYTPTLSEKLTENFYLWEYRGRGWFLWDAPVELEPPFEHFSRHRAYTHAVVDDGRKPTFLSSLAEKVKRALNPPQSHVEIASTMEAPLEYIAAPYEDSFNLHELGIVLPAEAKISSEYMEQLLLSLGSCDWPLSFEIVGSSDSISLQIACREPDVLLVKGELLSFFPEATISEGVNLLDRLRPDGKETIAIDFGFNQEFMRPLRTFKGFDPDPFLGIFGILEYLEPDELGMVQILFQAVRKPWAESIMRAVTDYDGGSFFGDSPEMASLAREKVHRPLYAAVVRAVAQSLSKERAWNIARGLAGGMSVYALPGSNEFIPLTNDDYDSIIHLEDVALRLSHRSGMILSGEELLGLVHFPSASVRSKKLLRKAPQKTKEAPAISQGHDYIIGENIHEGKTKIVSLAREQRIRHVHILGSTGTGKSTLLLNLINQDMQHGAGIGVLDPHGDLIDRILCFVPDERMEDVILFDPADTQSPIGFNILQAHSEIEKIVLASDLVGIFRRFSTSWGDQMNTVLGNAVSAFMESPGTKTLLDLRRFLVEREFRDRIVRSIQDPAVTYYWQKEFPLLKGNPQSSILTRLDVFLRPKLIRNVVSQSEGLDFADIVQNKRILLVKLAQGLIGEENAYLLGSLITSKLHQMAMAQQAKLSEAREYFFLYLDEFQHFATPSMASILSGARKYHFGLTLAHQELRQLWDVDKALANSVISNAGTRIYFRLGDFDAQKLQDGFTYFDGRDMQNLGIGEAIARIEQRDSDFNLKTFPPPEIDEDAAQRKRETIIKLSREKYGGTPFTYETPAREETPLPEPVLNDITQKPPEKKHVVQPIKEIPKTHTPTAEEREVSQHRYLQTLVKQMAEQRGYKAVIEEPTPDGTGRVDVGLERAGKRYACEISVTTNAAQELRNAQKCLRAGYEKVFLCATDKKNLELLKKGIQDELSFEEQSKVFFLVPEDLFVYLEQRAAESIVHEEHIKGYRVKVEYKAVSEAEMEKKREAVAQVILNSMRRMKEKKD